jgi:transglutaminase-like putative cysteine protease
MARTSGSTARFQRLIALGATTLLATATAVSFGRVFSGPGVTMKLVLAGVLSAGVAALLERRSLILATATSAVLMLMFTALAVFPDSTWFGLPTVGTLERLASGAVQVGEQARVQVAPTAPLQPLLLAAITAVWAAVFSAHALAFRAGSPLLALLPPVALLAFADTVLEELEKPLYGVFFLLAAIVVVFSDGLRRLQGWGPLWGSGNAERALYRTAARGARRVTATAILLAAAAPILVPGFGSAGVIDLTALDQDRRIALSPLVSISAELKRSEPFEIFRVESPVQTYHRMIALADFNGSTWAEPSEQAGSTIGSGDAILPPDVADGEHVQQTYRISRGTRYPWLPVAYAPAAVQIDRDMRLDRVSTTIWIDKYLDRGDSYTTSSVMVTPTPEQLDAVDFTATARADDPAVRLPADMSPQIREIAARWSKGSTSTYRQILAIQDHLRDQSRFTYSTEVPARGDSFTILDFLTETRKGFCQQFASAMAVLLRTQGIPTRVVVGFTQGTPVPGREDTYRVTTDNYHAWVEVRFPSYGWLAFEPTPTRQNPVALPYLAPSEPCQGEGCATGSPGGPTGVQLGGLPGDGSVPPLIARAESLVGPRRRSEAPAPEVPAGPSAAILLAVGAGVVVLFLVATPLFRGWRRRRSLRRAGPAPRSLILAHYDVFTERAGDLGWGRAPAETPEEYRKRVAASGKIPDGDLDRLTLLTVSAAYREAEPDGGDVTTARLAAATALRGLRKATPPVKRITGLYRRRD